MINNYQRDAGSEDDRDSGSMSLISQFEEGDQVIFRIEIFQSGGIYFYFYFRSG